MRRAAAMALVMLIALAAPAQQGISYQAALRNAQGEPMANREVRLRLTLREGATDRYTETQTVTTTALGLINVVVGEGTPVSGDFGQLDWSHQYDLVVEIDAELSGSYTQLQASALHPVPQAQWARVASELQMPESRGLTLQPKPTAQLHEDSVLFGVRNKNGDLVFAVYNSGVAVYVDDRDNGSRPQRAGFMVGGMDGTRDGTQRTLFAVDGTGTQVLVDEGTGGRPQRAGFRVGGMDGTRDGERAQRNLFEVDASGTRVHVDGRDATGRPQRAGFRVGGMDGTRAGSTLLTVDSSGTSVFIDDAATAGRPQRAGFRVGGMDGTRASQPANYFVVTSDSTRVYVDERNRPQRAGFAVGGMDGTRAGDSRYMDITRDNYIIGHGAGKALMGGTATGKNNSIMGTNAAPKMEGNSNVAIGNQAGNAVITGDYNVFVGANSARLPKKTSQTVAIGYQAGEGVSTSDYQNGVFVGYRAGFNNKTGNNNVFIGSKAGVGNTTGSSNIFIGDSAALGNTSGKNNVVMGKNAGMKKSTGDDNVVIGTNAYAQANGGLQNVLIGNAVAQYAKLNNTVVIGDKAGQGEAKEGVTSQSGANSVAIGVQAGYTTIGTQNVFVGYKAGQGNKSGAQNVFIGNQTGVANTDGTSNVFMGNQAGAANVSGANNVVLGTNAAQTAKSMTRTIAIGNEAGMGTANSTNTDDIFIGYQAGYSNTTGSNNVFVGNKAGYKNQGGTATYVGGNDPVTGVSLRQKPGDNNVYIGNNSGYNNSKGWNNVYLGYYAGAGGVDGKRNVYIGNFAGSKAINDNNVFIGSSAGENYKGKARSSEAAESSGRNVVIGYCAGYGGYVPEADQANINYTNNIIIGQFAGQKLTTGSSNIFIGSNAGTNHTTENNKLVIGSGNNGLLYGDLSSNWLVINGTNNNGNKLYVNGTAGGTSAWSSSSDRRLKTNIRPLENALAKVMKLNGVNFRWKDETNHRPGNNVGFIAQEVLEVLPEVVSGGGKDENGNEVYYSVEYGSVVPVLVEAIKELKAEKDELKQQVDELKKLVEQLLKK